MDGPGKFIPKIKSFFRTFEIFLVDGFCDQNILLDLVVRWQELRAAAEDVQIASET